MASGSGVAGSVSLGPPNTLGSSSGLDQFFEAVLAAIGAPITRNNLSVLDAFAHSEEPGLNPADTSGTGLNPWNPLNTRSGPGGGFANPNEATGQSNTARFLTNGNFPHLLANLRNDAPPQAYAPGSAAAHDLAYWQGAGPTNSGNSIASRVIAGLPSGLSTVPVDLGLGGGAIVTPAAPAAHTPAGQAASGAITDAGLGALAGALGLGGGLGSIGAGLTGIGGSVGAIGTAINPLNWGPALIGDVAQAALWPFATAANALHDFTVGEWNKSKDWGAANIIALGVAAVILIILFAGEGKGSQSATTQSVTVVPPAKGGGAGEAPAAGEGAAGGEAAAVAAV